MFLLCSYYILGVPSLGFPVKSLYSMGYFNDASNDIDHCSGVQGVGSGFKVDRV